MKSQTDPIKILLAQVIFILIILIKAVIKKKFIFFQENVLFDFSNNLE